MLYMLPMAMSFLTTMQYVIYFGFVDDVMFLYNRLNKPESKMMRMFQVAALGRILPSPTASCLV